MFDAVTYAAAVAAAKKSAGGGIVPLVITENDYALEEMINQFEKGGAIYFQGDFEAEFMGEEISAHATLSNPSVMDLEGMYVFSFSCTFLLQGVEAVAIATVSAFGTEKSLKFNGG